MAKKSKKTKKKGGTKHRSAAQKAATRKMIAANKARHRGKKGKRKGKGGKHRSAAQRAATNKLIALNKSRAKGKAPAKKKGKKRGLHRYANVSMCLKCRKPIFGGAKGMVTHQRKHHGGASTGGGGGGYTPHQMSYLERKREELKYKKLFDEQEAAEKERAAVRAAYQGSLGH